MYQHRINVELATVVKSCVDAGQTVVRVKCGPIITPLSAARAEGGAVLTLLYNCPPVLQSQVRVMM